MVGPTIETLRRDYGDNLRVVFKHFVVHPQIATTPALAACAAGLQGKFWEFEREIWRIAWELEPQPRLKDPRLLDPRSMETIAKRLGLDLERFRADVAGEACKNDLAQDQQTLAQVGTQGTPTFYLNGRILTGAQPLEQFKAVIDEELRKADAAIQGGVPAEDYYDQIVVARGRKSL